MKFTKRPLGYVKQGLEEMGHTVSHVYEDLIFPDNSAFIIQFGDESYELKIHINKECSQSDSEIIRNDMIETLSGKTGFALEFAGSFKMEQDRHELLKLVFYPGV